MFRWMWERAGRKTDAALFLLRFRDGVSCILPAHVRCVNCAKYRAFVAHSCGLWGTNDAVVSFLPRVDVYATSICAKRPHCTVQDGCESHMGFCIWEPRLDCQCRMPPSLFFSPHFPSGVAFYRAPEAARRMRLLKYITCKNALPDALFDKEAHE